jgi:CHAD domain-containing protein
MKEGKWIAGLTPEMPLAEAARLVLPARLNAVLHHLPYAVKSAARDPEHVHQLRVSTRRATAAVRLLGDCLPGKHHRTLRKCLRALRRSGGAARDWDVFFEMLSKAPELQPASAKAARDFLFGLQTSRRCDAQTELANAANDAGGNLEVETAKVADQSFEWNDGSKQTTGELAMDQIGSLIDAFGVASTPPPKIYEDLHRLRIVGKRLRYSMEIFADCFAAPLREQLYPAIVEMQEILGRITDAHVATERFIEIRDHVRSFHPGDWRRFRKPVEQLILAQRRVLPRERKRFLAWLVNWRKLTGEWPLESFAM